MGGAGDVPWDPGAPPDTNPGGNAPRPVRPGQRSRLLPWTLDGGGSVGTVKGLPATCRMQGAGPRVRLADVLPPGGTHPADRVGELTPRRCRDILPASPMASDVGRATAGRPAAAAGQRMRRRRTVMPVPAGSAGSPVRDSGTDLRPGVAGDADRPRSSRLARMKQPPCPEPGVLTIVRRRLPDRCQRPPAGFPTGWLVTSPTGPAGPPRMSAGPPASQMPPGGHPPGIGTASGGA